MRIKESHRVVVMGSGGVGKTSIVTQFMQGMFTTTYKPTIEDYYSHNIQLNGEFHTIEILDTSGTHYFPAMRELSIRSGRAFVLVFSLDNLASFHEVIALWDVVKKIRGDDGVPMVLVGNKADLLEDRKVTLELIAQNKLQFMNDCPYIETSAMFNRNIVTLFLELFKQANKNGSNDLSSPSSSCSKKFLERNSSTGSGNGGGSSSAHGTPEMGRRSRKLSRRLSSFGSLPNISLIRRKSSTNSSTKSNSSQKSVDATSASASGGATCSISGSKDDAKSSSAAGDGPPPTPKTPKDCKSSSSAFGFGRQNSNSSTTSATSQLASYNNGVRSGATGHHLVAKKSSSVDTPGPSSSSSHHSASSIISSLTSGISSAAASAASSAASAASTAAAKNSSGPSHHHHHFTGSSSHKNSSSIHSFTRKGPSGVEQLIANNIIGINELVDDGMAGLKRCVINGIDTISLTDGSRPAPVDPKCTIL